MSESGEIKTFPCGTASDRSVTLREDKRDGNRMELGLPTKPVTGRKEVEYYDPALGWVVRRIDCEGPIHATKCFQSLVTYITNGKVGVVQRREDSNGLDPCYFPPHVLLSVIENDHYVEEYYRFSNALSSYTFSWNGIPYIAIRRPYTSPNEDKVLKCGLDERPVVLNENGVVLAVGVSMNPDHSFTVRDLSNGRPDKIVSAGKIVLGRLMEECMVNDFYALPEGILIYCETEEVSPVLLLTYTGEVRVVVNSVDAEFNSLD
jgi:hypothetical protein